MYNSTIRQKKCKCGCGKMPSISFNGYHYSCAPDELKEKVGNKRKIAQRKANERTRVRSLNQLEGNKDMVEKKKNGRDIELENYFRLAEMELASSPYCQECGTKIPSEYFHDAIAHIFPKARFFSIRANYNNRLFLGAGCGCHDRTHRLDTFSTMKIFPEAVRKFKLFENEITETHKYKSLFLEYTNQL